MNVLARTKLGRVSATATASACSLESAGVGVGADADADAARSGLEVSLLLHLSDTHFGTEDGEVMEALADMALRERPQALVVTGDVTQHARPEEFAAAARFFARLAAREQLVVPGNHDLPPWDLLRRVVAPYSAFRQAFGEDLEPRLQSRDLWVAGLRTTRRWRHHEGTLSGAQVQQTADWFNSAPPQALRVVAMHHPVVVAAADDDDIADTDVLANAAFAIETWARAGVHLVLSGHTHQPCFVPLQHGDTGAGLPAASMWAVQAGTAVSRHLRGHKAHSVNLLRRLGTGGWRVEQWTHAAEARAFVMSDWLSVPTVAVAAFAT